MTIAGHRSARMAQIMLKVIGSGVMPGTRSLLPVALCAAAPGAGKTEAASRSAKNRDELSLYPDPQQRPVSEEPEAGQLEQSLASFRELLDRQSAWWQDKCSTMQPRVQSVYSYLSNPPAEFYPRAGIIGLAGIVGVLLGRGSRSKRLLYPAGLLTLTAAASYPERAAAIAMAAGDSVYARAVEGYAAVQKMLKPQDKDAKAADSETKPR